MVGGAAEVTQQLRTLAVPPDDPRLKSLYLAGGEAHFFFTKIYFICVSECLGPACMNVPLVWRLEEGIETSRTGVTSATMWVPGTEPESSSVAAASAVNQ